MSSTTAAAPAVATSATTTTFMECQTYWCHLCNMSVTLSLSSSSSAITTSLLCPHCNSDFLEELLISDNPNPNYSGQNSSQLLFPSLFDPSIPTTSADSTTTFHFPSVTSSDDNFLLDSPYLHRLIRHLTNSDESSPSITTTTTSRHSPASKSVVEAIPLVKITSAFLDIDPIVLCAVCKDQFKIEDETKQLPCKHMYHPDCILPWLSQHNSCPVCRFQLPTESVNRDSKARRRSRSRAFRLGDLMEDDDEAMMGIGLRHLNRLVFPMSHHQYQQPEVEPEVLFPSTQNSETVEVDMLPDLGRENRLETVSGWPNWPVDGGAANGGEIGVNAAWLDDVDVAMP